MSAETPRRSRSQGGGTGSLNPATACPQQVNDRSIIDSVAGFINEVVPTAYSTPADSKDHIQWVHFEHIDRNQSECFDSTDCENGIPPPLVVILGYGSGIQVWAVPLSGDAVEVLSWRHGSVRVLRILPNPSSNCSSDVTDLYADKRPLMVLCDTATPGPQYFSLSFISLKTGEQVKNIKFKNPVLDVLANKKSVVVTFAERIAVFDAFTLEDRITVTTCYLSPGLNPNPVALGTRWLAYAEKKLIPARRSGGGNEGEGVQSYTATVLHAAKSLGKGLRELGETVASSLAGGSAASAPHIAGPGLADILQPGVVTILDVQSPAASSAERGLPVEAVVAHFTAHSEALVCLQFDPSGMLLLTADKRGHDFHLFRIQPHPGGPSLAAVHHLYTLHRGDTTARVQHMCFSPDSRWAAVSTLRGTTHVFPVTPYGGAVGIRTHATPHVVNRMSRFHRSAGLPVEGRPHSPVSQLDVPVQAGVPYRNPRLPPYPHPTVVRPLAQLRQALNFPMAGAAIAPRAGPGRARLGSAPDDPVQVALRVAACFAAPRAWLDTIGQSRDAGRKQRRPVESLFIISSYGSLVQYDLEPRHSAGVPKEKVCDDTPVELKVAACAQWTLQRPTSCGDVQAPLPPDNLLLCAAGRARAPRPGRPASADDHWLSQVEIVTHAGPHRRLWMGPQFTFKTYGGAGGSPVSVLETEAVEPVGSAALHLLRSKPLNMPDDGVPVLIESGSASSFEQSPRLLDREVRGSCGESQLREDLADAMLESPGRARDNSCRCVVVSLKHNAHIVAKVVNPLGTVVTVQSEPEQEPGADPIEDVVIHENCDESLFRPVVGLKPAKCLQPEIIEEPLLDMGSIAADRYQGLQLDQIVNIPEESPAVEKVGKKTRKAKNKLGVRVHNSLDRNTPEPERRAHEKAESLSVYQEEGEKEMWSSINEMMESQLKTDSSLDEVACHAYNPEEISTLLDANLSPTEEVVTYAKVARADEEASTNAVESQADTTESDDSIKNKSPECKADADEDVPEDVTAISLPVTTQSVQKLSKKKAKKKRK